MHIETALVFVLIVKLVQGDGLTDPVSVGVIRNGNDIGNKKNVKDDFIDSENETIDEWRLIQHFVLDLFGLEDKSFNRGIEESRGLRGGGGKGKGKDKGFMEKVLPMMVMPFMVSTSMIPMMMLSLIGMLMKSALIGKIGIILMIINFLRPRNTGGGVYSHNVNLRNDLAMEHYGYRGDEEYGAYVNRKRRRKRNI